MSWNDRMGEVVTCQKCNHLFFIDGECTTCPTSPEPEYEDYAVEEINIVHPDGWKPF